MPEPSRGKRRRATQMQRRADRVGAPVKARPKTAPVRGGTVSSRMPGTWWLAAGVIVVVAVVAVIVIVRPGSGSGGVGAARALGRTSAATGTCPTSQPARCPPARRGP